jgi:glycosyltransferase involved in cell wall biosynthesis
VPINDINASCTSDRSAGAARTLTVVHLTGSPFVGGPESQMLGLARSLPERYRTVFLCFADRGRSAALLDRVRQLGLEGHPLRHDAPHWRAVIGEVAGHLQRLRADVLCCHGYKADILGLLAARRAKVPAVAVAHGWTSATAKVRLNEALDKLSLRWMDRVVCVSEQQAVKVRRVGVRADRAVVIRNAVWCRDADGSDPALRRRLESLFAQRPTRIVGAAGRLSPEKGFAVLIEAARRVVGEDPQAGFVLFGDGPLRAALARRIAAAGLDGRFVLAGFYADLADYLPQLDLAVLPSYTEGLPCVVLEAFAAGVPVVATAVGGTPEAVEDGRHGYLVPPGDPAALAGRILDLLRCPSTRRTMGERARQHVRQQFSFQAQNPHYQRLFESLVPWPSA